MRTIVRSILLLWLISPIAQAQDFSAILQSIERHSLRLESARQESEAQKAESRAEVAVDDLALGFNYLWGKDGIGDRKDFNVSQTFDFPNVIALKHKMAREMQRVSDLQYLSERQQVLLTAHKLCIEVVYCNAMMEHLNEDLEETQAMAQAYETLFSKGEATVIDHNKAHQELLFFQAEYREFLAMKESLMSELQCMNGGEPVIIDDTAYVQAPLPKEFEVWLSQHIETLPEVQLAAGEVSVNERTLKVAKNQWAPGLSVGYMGEFTKADKYHGPTIGLSLPLWSNGRKVKSAKLHLQSAETALEEVRMHLKNRLNAVYRDALQLQETCRAFSKHLTECDNTSLLQKSLNAGQINLITYLQERQYVHEMHVKLLEAERDLALRMAELKVY